MKMSLLIVGGAGLAGAVLLANQHPQFNDDQTAAQVGLGRASCQTSARGPQANPFLKWAMAEETSAPTSTQKDGVEPAFAAVTKAQALASKASDKERALIGGLAARYSNDSKAERPPLEMAYAQAMGKVVALFPRDQDIGALYAEALMDTQPWDYWEAGGSQPKNRAGEILSTLERVLKDNPDHAGAIKSFESAGDAQDKLGYMEPRYWYYSVRQSLGAMLVKAGELDKAEQAYRSSLAKAPNDAWAGPADTLDLAKL